MLRCEICNKEIEKSCYSNAVLCGTKCFKKHYWNEIVTEKEEHIVINGVCYCDAGDRPGEKPSYLGHAGRRFWIRYFDGKTVTTNNLWYQGEIPEEYRSALPDNAEFYTPNHIKFANSIIGGGNY